MSLLCRVGLHDFAWPPHEPPWQLFERIGVSCARGCGARTTRTCLRDDHWAERHPEPRWYTEQFDGKPSWADDEEDEA